MRVSVIVCTRNEENYIENCLRQLKNQTIKPEIIVVDAHSKDKTVEIAKKYADKILYDNKSGISDARNIGWRNAKGEIVAYCDADCLPKKDWIEKLTRFMNGNSAISGPLFPYDGNLWNKINFKIWAVFFPEFLSILGFNFLWGSNMAFKKKILKRHPFEAKFLEDYDMARKIRKVAKIKFDRRLRMPQSYRRFRNGFLKISFEYYIVNFIKIHFLKNRRIKGYY